MIGNPYQRNAMISGLGIVSLNPFQESLPNLIQRLLFKTSSKCSLLNVSSVDSGGDGSGDEA